MSTFDQTPGPSRGFSFALVEDAGRLALRAQHRPEYGAILADWASADVQRRVAAGKRQLLARAVGLHKRAGLQALEILDATAGLGRDGFTLAALGARVTMVERHPQIAALLADAQRRALGDPALAAIAARIEILAQDAAQVLANGRRWDVIYLDPMYPHTNKSALPQKEMQFFRELTDGDPDSAALLAPALHAARLRVVVKRPAKAPWLALRPPSLDFASTQARFDVYLVSG